MNENTSYVTVHAAPLKAVARAIIGRTGSNEREAGLVADQLVEANLSVDIIARVIQRGEQDGRAMVRGDEPVRRRRRRSPANWTGSVRYRTDDERSASYGVRHLFSRT
jgi:hypothetical protein